MRTLALIPARGGSKGLVRKNVRELAGRPLVTWTIEAARSCTAVDRVVVSTDDQEIAEVCGASGAEVPFLRPVELARDDTPDRPVYDHAIAWLANEGYSPDVVVWLRPTAPLREPDDIAGGLAVLERSGCDSVRSVCQAEHHPYWMCTLDRDRVQPLMQGVDAAAFPRRQLLPPAYRLNGAVDALRCATLPDGPELFGGDVGGFVMPPERSVDIDSELDLLVAELLLERRRA